MATFDFALVWRRLLHGFLLLLSRSIRPSPSPFFAVLLLCFSRRRHRCSVELCRRRRAFPSSAKLAIALFVPGAPNKPALVAWFHRETPLVAFLPRGRQHRRRVRFTVAVALRWASALAKPGSSFTELPWLSMTTWLLRLSFAVAETPPSMNSVSFCYFCVELIRAPKIMKIFVWPLCDVYYLGKIWNVTFQ